MRVAAIGAVIAFVAITAPAARSGAAPASSCTSSSGVTVIVDFSAFGRAIERGCAAGRPANALAALHDAGFASAGTANYGDAFLCRIDGLPSPKSESCATTPPGNSSWSFYDAKPSDAAWTYSRTGVLSYQPQAGTLIAFAFGNYAKPTVRPSGATVTTAPTTRPTPPRTSAPSTVPATTPHVTGEVTRPVSAMTPSTTNAAPTSTTSASTSAPSTTTAGATTTSPTTSPSTAPQSNTTLPIIDRNTAHIVSRDSSGSPIPVLLTIGLVVLLGAIGLLIVRARRSRSA